MSLVIPIFVGGREGGRWFIEFPGGVVKKRESPDFRSPEVGISAVYWKKVYSFYRKAHYKD